MEEKNQTTTSFDPNDKYKDDTYQLLSIGVSLVKLRIISVDDYLFYVFGIERDK